MKTTICAGHGTMNLVMAGLVTVAAFSCSGRGNIDLSKATPVNTEPVSGKGPNGTVPEGSTQFNSLFSYQPGEIVSRKVGSVMDQTGTSLESDYDGDGLTNDQERASSQWVADYPRIEASVSTPVTLTIDIEKSRKRDNDSITSNITSDDFEDNRDKGTENIHRNELGTKTTQIQDKYSGNSEQSHSTNTNSSAGSEFNAGLGSDGASLFSVSGGGKGSSSSGNSWSKSNSISETKTTFPDAPATNNLDRDGWSVKTNSAAKNARQYRADKSDRVNETSIVRPNAGRVRAALYIKNFSVNMPVRLTNILCTLMFETPTGQLIPMQSFRLRNDDFSLFTLNLYGASEFGPYVIDLAGLNTVEVENAIRLGYNPKIFIVDYDISHVPNSNYKAILPGVIGDNVKIVEENAKGRTALVKVKGPGIREMYRVAAWEFDQATDPCAANSSGNFRPGVSLENVLKRLNCARQNGQLDGVGVDFEAGDYIIDFSDVLPNLPADQKVLVHGIKRLAGLETKVPCSSLESKTGNDGITRSVCRMKKVTEFTADDNRDFGMWLVFANGKYYSHSDYAKTGNNLVVFDGQNTNSEKVLRGISSIVWAGDNYDLIYVSLQELLAVQGRFGTNPLETNQQLTISTKWDSSKVGSLNTKYQPDKFSVFLGKAAKGDMVELTFKLNSNKQLQYNFGSNTAVSTPGYSTYKNFEYSLNTLTNRFNIQDALKFEVSMGLGGNATDWDDVTNTTRLKPCNANTAGNLDASVDFVAQTFTVCFVVPGSDYDYSASGLPTLVNLYLRPKLLDEYRNVIWPEKLTEVKKFKGQINVDVAAGATKIQISNVVGTINVNDTLKIGANNTEYRITAVTPEVANPKLINLDIERVSAGTGLAQAHKQFDVVKANSAQLQNPLVTVNITNNYFQTWNSYLGAINTPCFPDTGCPFNTSFSGSTLGLIGLTYNESNLNWVGRNYFYKDRYDFNQLDASKYEGFMNADFGSLSVVPNIPSEKISLSREYFSPAMEIGKPLTTAYRIQNRGYIVDSKLVNIWREVAYDGSRTSIVMKVIDSQTGGTSPSIQIASVVNSGGGEGIHENFEVIQHGNKFYIAWYQLNSSGINGVYGAKITIGQNINDVTLSNITIANSPLSYPLIGGYDRVSLHLMPDSNIVFAVYRIIGSSGSYPVSWIHPIDIGEARHDLLTPISFNGTYSYTVAVDGNTVLAAYYPVMSSRIAVQVFNYAGGWTVGTPAIFYFPGMDTDGYDRGRLAFKNGKALMSWLIGGQGSLYVPLRIQGTVPSMIGTLTKPPQPEDYPPVSSYIFGMNLVDGYGYLSWKWARANGDKNSLVSKIDLDTGAALSSITIPEISPSDPPQILEVGSTLKYGANIYNQLRIMTLNTTDMSTNLTQVLSVGSYGAFSGFLSLRPTTMTSGPDLYFTWVDGFEESEGGNIYRLYGVTGGGPLQYGLNNFFTAPLIERNYTVTAKLR